MSLFTSLAFAMAIYLAVVERQERVRSRPTSPAAAPDDPDPDRAVAPT